MSNAYATIQGQGNNDQPRVSCLLRPYRDGDWHDPLTRYSVQGPGNEVQEFSTLKDANKYASIRRRAKDQREAGNLYVKWATA